MVCSQFLRSWGLCTQLILFTVLLNKSVFASPTTVKITTDSFELNNDDIPSSTLVPSNDDPQLWVMSDSATESTVNNEIVNEKADIGKISEETAAKETAERSKRSFDDNFKYPTTPQPDNNTEFITSIPTANDNVVTELPKSTDRIIKGRMNCRCGTYRAKIVGGEDASINEYPWTVALVRKGKANKGAYCGGTLINDRYIATASHCVDGASPERIQVWLNHENFQNEDLNTTIQRDVVNIMMHEDYNSKTIDNDIALLKLDEPVSIGDTEGSIIPACIPADNSNTYEDQESTVCGWGATSQGGPVSAQLQCVTVPIISNKDCNWRSLYLGKITDNMLCAGELSSGGKDSCQGDSGGPLVVQNEDQKTLVGIVSFGYGCARPLAPGVYTRVGQYPSWIQQNTQDAEYCSS